LPWGHNVVLPTRLKDRNERAPELSAEGGFTPMNDLDLIVPLDTFQDVAYELARQGALCRQIAVGLPRALSLEPAGPVSIPLFAGADAGSCQDASVRDCPACICARRAAEVRSRARPRDCDHQCADPGLWRHFDELEHRYGDDTPEGGTTEVTTGSLDDNGGGGLKR
jgi:hypothetical protein